MHVGYFLGKYNIRSNLLRWHPTVFIIIINGTLARSLEPVVTECKDHTIYTQTQVVASRKPKKKKTHTRRRGKLDHIISTKAPSNYSNVDLPRKKNPAHNARLPITEPLLLMMLSQGDTQKMTSRRQYCNVVTNATCKTPVGQVYYSV